ncbi:hypothetical protein F0562_021081 [Nyssa sinensis]|uniref:Protein kinase domain-containing protein n=1 Tax=Nyssa sinensis TaxID=561372 RepID=A0A5J5BKZ6_9ASTE|nr:hypothetical protein F0562_021081 [Nyssa sinensis]
MQFKIQLFFFYCCIGCFSFGFAEVGDEVSILLSIKAGLIDPLDQLQDWKLPNNGVGNNPVHCNWTGVWCNSNGAVEKLDLSHMNLSGSVSDDIQRLRSLTSLNLCCNGFSSPLPKSISNLIALKSIDLSQNFFLDSFPVGLGKAAGLTQLNASSNNFSGYLPEDLGNATLLEILDLRGNFFQGSIPGSFKNLGKLKFLGLSGNNLTGQIPPELGQLSSLESLVIGFNEFEGKIPPAIGNITSLQLLDLSDNMLSGEIPAEIAQLKNLQLLNLMCNQLSGSVPPGLGGLTQLGAYAMEVTSLSSSFSTMLSLVQLPAELSTCTSLVRVRMQNNLLSGTIPVGFGKLGKLQRLELANNSLTGQIPNDLASSASLSFIDLSQNRLQSSLPSSILSIPNLQNFMASNNNLVGQIPDQFQDCPSLSVLDLSSNHFTGSIPASIASCGKLENFGDSPALEMLNVSYNKLEGPIPANGMLRTINPDDLMGNAGLCGSVLPPCSHNSGYTSRQRTLHARHIVAGWVIGISSILAVGIAFFGVPISIQKVRIGFTSNDILACIKESNVIGMGATGIVYKAEMQRLNTTVAVKKLWRTETDIEMGSSDDLVGEVNVLGRLRHRNIVRLLGFLHNDTNAMIVYEYMQNGSLGEGFAWQTSREVAGRLGLAI